MKVVISLSTEEANAILADVLSHRHGIMREDLCIVIGGENHVQNVHDATIKMRKNLIKRIEGLLPNSKLSAIKEFRIVTQAYLKEAKDFVESPEKWEHFIKTGEYL